MGHIHLDEVLAREELLPDRDLVLHHFSARYAPNEVERICAQRIPERLMSRVRVLGQDQPGSHASYPVAAGHGVTEVSESDAHRRAAQPGTE
jgi:hypothetical protein